MAAASTIIAAAALAYGVYSGEEGKNQARAADQKATREMQAAEVEKNNQQTALKGTRERDMMRLRQKGNANSGNASTSSSGTIGTQSTTPQSPMGNYSGKTLLGE